MIDIFDNLNFANKIYFKNILFRIKWIFKLIIKINYNFIKN